MSSINHAKKAAGFEAATYIQPGMTVGLGTGSTTVYFIEALIERVARGLRCTAVATSKHSYKLAKAGGIEVRDVNDLKTIDLTVDGADEIDPQKRMIKGGGGAHLREKIVATMSDELIIIVDSTKEVAQLGRTPLPVEIIPFAFRATVNHLTKAGFPGALRHAANGSLFLTENQNYIYDIAFPGPILNPEEVNSILEQIPGVVETGLFLYFQPKVIVGFEDGRTEIRA